MNEEEYDHRAYLYVAASDCGVVKVGRTRNIRSRRQSTGTEFKRRGLRMTSFEFFHAEQERIAEMDLVAWMALRYPSHGGREWFKPADPLAAGVEAARLAAIGLERYLKWDQEVKAKYAAEDAKNAARKQRAFMRDTLPGVVFSGIAYALSSYGQPLNDDISSLRVLEALIERAKGFAHP